MKVRRATQLDSAILCELIIASGSKSLTAIFDIDAEFNCKSFIASALLEQNGQFGFGNHWIVEKSGIAMGVVSAWHSELDKEFHHATLQSVVRYYGEKHSIGVLARSQIVQTFIPKPTKSQWCIGHLAVLSSFHRQGLGSTLLNFMAEKAILHGRSALTLDVPIDKQSAIDFYLKYGFNIKGYSINSDVMHKAGFAQHVHLQKLI